MDALLQEAWNLGGFAVAFVVAMFMLREVNQARITELKDRLTQERDDKALLITTIKGVTEAFTDFRGLLSEVRAMMGTTKEAVDGQVQALAEHRIEEEKWLSDILTRDRKMPKA